MELQLSKLRRSKFVYSQRINENVTAFFHSLNMELLFVASKNNIIFSDYCMMNPELQKEAIAKEFLVSSLEDEVGQGMKIAEDMSIGEISFSVFKMMITDSCNLNCKYCLIEKNFIDRKTQCKNLSYDTASNLLRSFWYTCKKTTKMKRTLMLYGGEPLLNGKVLESVIIQTREAELKGLTNGPVEIVLETNGTLVTEDIARFLASNNVFVIVSLDGNSSIHNENRKFKNGKGSWDRALNGFKTLRKNKVNVVVSCVFTKTFAHQSNSVITDLIREVDPKSIGLNLFHVLQNRPIPQDETITLIKEYIQTWEIARKEGLYIEHVMRRIRPLVTQKIRAVDCQACGHRLVSDTSGKLGICEGFLGLDYYFKSRYDLDSIYKDDVFQTWASRSQLKMKQCLGCNSQGICGGGCVYNGIVLNGEVNAPDPYICEAAQGLVKWAIKTWFNETSIKRILSKDSWAWLKSDERNAILGNVPLFPDIPLQNMSKNSEKCKLI